MYKSLIIACCIVLLAGCKPDSGKIIYELPELTYPVTAQAETTDDYFGTIVKDPYRWLEDDTAQAVAAWVKQQNEVTFGFLENIPFREKIKTRLTELYNYERVGGVVKAGEYILFSKNDGLRNQPVLYKRKGFDGPDEVFIDPNLLSEDGTVAVNLIGVSDDKKYVAYSKSVAGSDWREIYVKEIATGRDLNDRLVNIKSTGAAWYGDGFFYSRFPEPEKGHALKGLNKYQKVYYHKLGDPQSKDVLIYEDTKNPLRYHNVGLSKDKKYLFLRIAEGTDGFEVHFKPADLKKGGFKPLFTGFKNKSSVIDHHNGLFYVLTDIDAPNYRLVAIDPANTGKENWKTIIPEKEHLLDGVMTAGGKLIADYIENVSSHLYLYDYDGTPEKEIEFPMICAAGVQYADKDEDQIIYSYASFTQPAAIRIYDLSSGEETKFFEPVLKFDPEAFEVKQVFYTSKDGTRVPMFLVYKKGLKLSGKNPALLYGYGGFNIPMLPSFNPAIITLTEKGAIYAVANLRGGSEFGEAWHQAGMLLNKQNVFDDFISAGEFLVNEKYTSPSRLGIYGGSNGGLLVGACANQRPDLFKVAMPSVGVMDMLRFHKFTVGFGWVPEYGSSEDSVHFNNLYAYSPLHNIAEGIEYPATLVTTGDHDDRVVPAHSFKYAAALQEKHKGKNPVLIRIETQAGHGAGKPLTKVIEETTDRWAFFLYNTQTAL